MKHPNKKKEISNSSTDYFDHSISVPVNKIFNYLYQVVFNPLSTMLTDTMKIQHKAHGAKVSQLLHCDVCPDQTIVKWITTCVESKDKFMNPF